MFVKYAVGIYALVVAIGPLSIDMYLPAIPTIRVDLGADIGQMHATMVVYLAGMAFGQLIYGPISDAFGRKRPLLFGLALYIFAVIGCVFATDIRTFIGLRALQALGASAGTVTIRAMIRDKHAPHDVARALSLLTAVIGIAPIVAPLLGSAALEWFGWRAIFALLGGWSIAMLIIVALKIEETHSRASGHLSWRLTWKGMRRLLSHGRFTRLAFAGAATHSTLMTYLSAAPIILGESFHLNASAIAGVFTFSGCSYICGAYINRSLLRTQRPAHLLKVGLLAHLGASSTMMLTGVFGWGGLPALLMQICCLMISIGIVAPNAAALALAPFRGRAGLAASMIGTLQYGLAASITYALGLAPGSSQVPLAIALMAIGLIVQVLMRMYPAVE